MYNRESQDRVREILEERRTTAIRIADQRNAEVAERSERIRAIDAELSGTGPRLFRAACAGEDITPLRERNAQLMQQRRQELLAMGYPADYTEVHYTCPRCSDTGYVDTRLCDCYRALLLTENIRASGMGELIERQSFDNFDLSWYADDPEVERRMAANLRRAHAFADGFATRAGGKNLLFMGKTGTGKTHLSTAIAKQLITAGYDVRYDTVQNIVAAFEQDQFKSGYNPDYEARGTRYLECDLLIMDDLGTEFTNSFTVSCLYNIFNTRENRGLATLVSTNLQADELMRKYDDRIYSRLVGSGYTVLLFGGRDYRLFGSRD